MLTQGVPLRNVILSMAIDIQQLLMRNGWRELSMCMQPGLKEPFSLQLAFAMLNV